MPSDTASGDTELRKGAGQAQLVGDLVEGSDKANTPLEYVSDISEILGGFDLDPCASQSSNLAAENIRESGGLSRSWDDYGTVWLNHPFSDPGPWLRKAVECDAETVVALSKCDPSADWFHDYALQADLLAFPDDRVNFIGYEWDAAFPVVYSVYGRVPDALRDWFEQNEEFSGWVVIP
jgi:hypothetical protein